MPASASRRSARSQTYSWIFRGSPRRSRGIVSMSRTKFTGASDQTLPHPRPFPIGSIGRPPALGGLRATSRPSGGHGGAGGARPHRPVHDAVASQPSPPRHAGGGAGRDERAILPVPLGAVHGGVGRRDGGLGGRRRLLERDAAGARRP